MPCCSEGVHRTHSVLALNPWQERHCGQTNREASSSQGSNDSRSDYSAPPTRSITSLTIARSASTPSTVGRTDRPRRTRDGKRDPIHDRLLLRPGADTRPATGIGSQIGEFPALWQGTFEKQHRGFLGARPEFFGHRTHATGHRTPCVFGVEADIEGHVDVSSADRWQAGIAQPDEPCCCGVVQRPVDFPVRDGVGCKCPRSIVSMLPIRAS